MMQNLNDFELLIKLSSIYSQQTIADEIHHPREVVNRWVKERSRQQDENWLTYSERITLEKMLLVPSGRNSEFTFIDLFAGIGRIRHGFELVGGKCVFTSEYDKYAIKTYQANYYCDHNIHGDIKEITQSEGMAKKKIYNFIQQSIPGHDATTKNKIRP